MHYFQYRDNELRCEEVPLKRLADEVGTPCYVYSRRTIERHVRVFQSALSELSHLICYSVKANANLGVLSLLAKQGCGADIVSGGELFRALKSGIDANKIVFSGAGKQAAEIEQALEAGILAFNVESEAELLLIDAVAKNRGVKAPVALRVNPNVDPKTHPYIATGLSESKFGIAAEQSLEVYRRAHRDLKHVMLVGIDCHIGSQLTQIDPFLEAFRHVLGMVKQLRSEGIALRLIDIGGGLGIQYDDEAPPSPADYGAQLKQALAEAALSDMTLICEPGRVIMGNAGVLLSRVLYRKRNAEKQFVIVDGAMNDLLRPALYKAYHAVLPVEQTDRPKEIVDVVGPICESGDFFARARELPRVEAGDLIAVMSAGAYGFTMSSNYNTRPRVAEVLVSGDRYDIVRTRETLDDLVRGESIPST